MNEKEVPFFSSQALCFAQSLFMCVKPEKISFFFEKGQNGNFAEIVQAKTWKFSRSQMMKWTSPLESSHEI